MTTHRALLAACALAFASTVPTHAQTSTPAQVSAAQFQELRWAEGNWEVAGGGDSFNQRIRFLNDSTIQIQTVDLAGDVRESAQVLLRDGQVAQERAGARWVATRVGAQEVVFEGEDGARAVWRAETRKEWSNEVTTTTGGQPRTVVYRLERIVL